MNYTPADEYRQADIRALKEFSEEPYRSPWRRDFARLIYSPSFRRLQGKTQLYPGTETDFFRNRLTHSLEVAQIAKSIAIKLNYDLKQDKKKYYIDPDIVEFASLAHDLGHPPFGHYGEKILDEKMRHYGGFESNAQALRIVTKLEKRHLIPNTNFGISNKGLDKRVGLNLAARSIASILKYDRMIPISRKNIGVVKGYYQSEKSLVDKVKKCVCGDSKQHESFKTVECQIMDIADDIAYSTYDLEDSFKAGFLSPLDLICASRQVLEAVTKDVSSKVGTKIDIDYLRERIRQIFFNLFESPIEITGDIRLSSELLRGLHFTSLQLGVDISKRISNVGYWRTDFTSKLVGSAIRQVHIEEIDRNIPALTTVAIEKEKLMDVAILKSCVYQSQILSSKMQIYSSRSDEIIREIFRALVENPKLLPEDFQEIYSNLREEKDKLRTICDFIAGMTDAFAIEFYGKLKSINPQSIFKPAW